MKKLLILLVITMSFSCDSSEGQADRKKTSNGDVIEGTDGIAEIGFGAEEQEIAIGPDYQTRLYFAIVEDSIMEYRFSSALRLHVQLKLPSGEEVPISEVSNLGYAFFEPGDYSFLVTSVDNARGSFSFVGSRLDKGRLKVDISINGITGQQRLPMIMRDYYILNLKKDRFLRAYLQSDDFSDPIFGVLTTKFEPINGALFYNPGLDAKENGIVYYDYWLSAGKYLVSIWDGADLPYTVGVDSHLKKLVLDGPAVAGESYNYGIDKNPSYYAIYVETPELISVKLLSGPSHKISLYNSDWGLLKEAELGVSKLTYDALKGDYYITVEAGQGEGIFQIQAESIKDTYVFETHPSGNGSIADTRLRVYESDYSTRLPCSGDSVISGIDDNSGQEILSRLVCPKEVFQPGSTYYLIVDGSYDAVDPRGGYSISMRSDAELDCSGSSVDEGDGSLDDSYESNDADIIATSIIFGCGNALASNLTTSDLDVFVFSAP